MGSSDYNFGAHFATPWKADSETTTQEFPLRSGCKSTSGWWSGHGCAFVSWASFCRFFFPGFMFFNCLEWGAAVGTNVFKFWCCGFGHFNVTRKKEQLFFRLFSGVSCHHFIIPSQPISLPSRELAEKMIFLFNRRDIYIYIYLY